MLWGFMAIVPETTAEGRPRVGELAQTVRHALLTIGMQGKVLASAMGLSESHLSRQLGEQGVNLARLLNAGPDFWSAFLKPLTQLAGLTRDQVLTIFNADTDAEREQRDLDRDARLAEVERQLQETQETLREVLRRLPPVQREELTSELVA